MSRPLFTIVLLLVCIIALQSTEGRRRLKKTRKTGFMGTKDCEEVFGSAAKDNSVHNSAAVKEQFCTTYVNLCGDIIRTPLFPEAVKCGGCIFAWMTHCTNPPRG